MTGRRPFAFVAKESKTNLQTGTAETGMDEVGTEEFWSGEGGEEGGRRDKVVCG